MSYRDIILKHCADVDSAQKAIANYFREDVTGSKIEAATANAPKHLSLLRRIDVVIWMLNNERVMAR